MYDRLKIALNQPKDAAALAAFRVLFGLVLAGSVVRYFATGWVQTFYVERAFHFTYWGFGWVAPVPEPGMTIVFSLLGIAAACIALGLAYRVATVSFLVLFTYVHLLDVTNYLNHYYLVTLLALILCVLPLHRAYSIDAWLRPSIRVATLPAWMTWLVRGQVGLVYFFAGLAKLQSDWLLHAQPLEIWLHARTDLPLVGPMLGEHWVALAASWAGFLYDTTIVGWLLWRRSRPFAFAAVCVFHLATHVLFNIGIFPFVMTVAATMFFDPEWPRRLWALLRRAPLTAVAPDEERSARWRIGPLGLAALGAYALVHVAMPLRAHVYAGNVLWHEQGFRWSWRVMVYQKDGDVTYRVRMDGDPRERLVRPRSYVDATQSAELARQPDLILQLAHRIADDLRAAGHTHVEVRADAFVALNGRPSARFIDPDADLASIDDGISPASWILPAPEGPPARLRSRGVHLALRETAR